MNLLGLFVKFILFPKKSTLGLNILSRYALLDAEAQLPRVRCYCALLPRPLAGLGSHVT